MTTQLIVPTERRIQLRDVTRQVREAVRDSGIRSGLCVLFCPHTTSGLAINENADPDVATDLERAFEAMVPQVPFRHVEGNSPAHLLSSLTRPSLQILIEDSQMLLGRWQAIYFCEFDGPRRRELWVKVIEG
jgi:secondary thiamine-phosphate synthase enzyme